MGNVVPTVIHAILTIFTDDFPSHLLSGNSSRLLPSMVVLEKPSHSSIRHDRSAVECRAQGRILSHAWQRAEGNKGRTETGESLQDSDEKLRKRLGHCTGSEKALQNNSGMRALAKLEYSWPRIRAILLVGFMYFVALSSNVNLLQFSTPFSRQPR